MGCTTTKNTNKTKLRHYIFKCMDIIKPICFDPSNNTVQIEELVRSYFCFKNSTKILYINENGEPVILSPNLPENIILNIFLEEELPPTLPISPIVPIPPSAKKSNKIGSNGAFRIIVVAYNGVRYRIECTSSTPIEEIKQEISEQGGISSAAQRFIYAAQQLEDGRTLADYNIQSECTVYMVSRLKGCQSSLLRI